MEISIFEFIFFYFLIVLSTIGLGFLSVKLVGEKNLNGLGYLGLLGVFFLIFYSMLGHLFFKHGLVSNSIVMLIGLTCFFLNIKTLVKKSELGIFFLTFTILFISVVIIKNHDDFSYYHFPYTYYLNEYPLIVGMGQYGHGFRTPSSLFYLNSIFYLPIVKYYMINVGALMIMGFSNLIILSNLIKTVKSKQFNYLFILGLLSFAFINIFFYRIAEHGTDRSAQILILIFVMELLYFIGSPKTYKLFLNKTFLLLGIIASLKAFYILYFIFFLQIFYTLYRNKFLFQILELLKLKNILFNLFFILILLVFLTYFFNTGCVIYPVSFTCFESNSWAIKIETVQAMNDWYQQWSKGGATPNYSVENPELYLQNFNWIKNWIDIYFFNKVSDFILGIIFLFIVLSIILFFKNRGFKIKTINTADKKIFLTYFIICVLTIEWFTNHPSLRYGGYVLIFLLLALPFAKLVEKNFQKLISIKTRALYFLVIVVVIFLARNIDRINNENEKYKNQRISLMKINFTVDESALRIDRRIKEEIKIYNNCTSNDNCKTKLDKKFNRFITKNK